MTSFLLWGTQGEMLRMYRPLFTLKVNEDLGCHKL